VGPCWGWQRQRCGERCGAWPRAPCSRSRGKGETQPPTSCGPKTGSDVPAFKGFPPMQTRPAWYWRIVAVIPYFLPLFEGWLYSESAITVYAPLFHYKVLCSPIVNVFAILPSWFLLAYFLAAYLGVVRNNRWPHFLRFHVVMGMLMEIILQVRSTSSYTTLYPPHAPIPSIPTTARPHSVLCTSCASMSSWACSWKSSSRYALFPHTYTLFTPTLSPPPFIRTLLFDSITVVLYYPSTVQH